tara:strand:+ start:138 stop:626 length:489 start_codon:yes stop_codon:yes gene_type:complete
MNNLKIILFVFLALALSRFIPHPPNFTSLIALSLYVPVVFGLKFIFVVIASYFVTDLFIGFHSTLFFTWGSVVLIGLLSNYFYKNIYYRVSGALIGAVIFYITTNFGVWINGSYGYNFNGLINCYIAAIPFFTYTVISTIFYSSILEMLIHLKTRYKISFKT